MEPGQIIKQARLSRGWSQADLARRVGISQPAIKKIESSGPDATRASKFLPKIAQVLDLDLNRLVPSLNSPALPAQPQTITPMAQLSGARDFPIHASAEGGPGQIIVTSDPVDYIPRPAPLIHVRGSYGILIAGTSMEPEFRPGDTALVNPHLPIIADEVYIFYAEREGEARAAIKHLRRATADNWLVTQHNPPEGSAKDFALARKEWQWVHRVIGKYRR